MMTSEERREQAFENWFDCNKEQLEQEFLDSRLDEWHCEEEGMELLESYSFEEWCEERFADDVRNGIV